MCGEKVLRFDYQIVEEDEEGVHTMLLVISDVTAEERRIEAEARQREVMAVFQHFLADRSGFLEFLADAGRLVDGLVSEGHGGDVAVAKRVLHTLKGNAGMFGLDRLVMLAHEIEDSVVESGEMPSRGQIDQLAGQWADLRQQLDDLVGERDGGLEITESEYRGLLHAVEDRRSRDELLSLIRAWRLEPASARLERLRERAKGIAARIGKRQIEIVVDTDDVRLAGERFRPFWSSFVHVVRNALDHGIETPQERIATGKTGPGRIHLAASVDGDEFVIQVSDDGRGIDWEKVRAKALRRGLPSDSHEDLVAAIFLDGFTTRESASLLSGRGVGLGAVKNAVNELGGRIELTSDETGTRFRFVFPLARLEGAVWASNLRQQLVSA